MNKKRILIIVSSILILIAGVTLLHHSNQNYFYTMAEDNVDAYTYTKQKIDYTENLKQSGYKVREVPLLVDFDVDFCPWIV